MQAATPPVANPHGSDASAQLQCFKAETADGVSRQWSRPSVAIEPGPLQLEAENLLDATLLIRLTWSPKLKIRRQNRLTMQPKSAIIH